MEKKKGRTGDKILLGIGITFAVIFGLILLLPGLLLVLFFVYVAQTEALDAVPDQIKVSNQSSTVIQSVEVNDTVISSQSLQLGDDLTVEWETWPATLTVFGEVGPLGQIELSRAPNKTDTTDCWYIIVQDSPEGLVFTQTHIEKLEKWIKSMEKKVGLDLPDGVILLYDAPGRGLQGDGHDFVIFRFGREEAAALETQFSVTQGWHRYEDRALLDKIFFEKNSFCRSYIYDVPIPAEGWYFFRDTYNSQHGANDENQWSVEDRVRPPQNYTAAIYDSTTRMLYILDYDS